MKIPAKSLAIILGTVIAVCQGGGYTPGPGPGPGPGPEPPGPSPDPDIDPDDETIFTEEDWNRIAEVMEYLCGEFEEIVSIDSEYSTYVYIRRLVKEAYA